MPIDKSLHMPFILIKYPCGHPPSSLGERDLFATRLTDPRAQNVKTLHCDLSPGPELTHDLNQSVKHGWN